MEGNRLERGNVEIISDWGLVASDWGLVTRDWGLVTRDWGLVTRDWGLGTSNLTATFEHHPIYIRGEAATTISHF